jgi:hypothetical protein
VPARVVLGQPGDRVAHALGVAGERQRAQRHPTVPCGARGTHRSDRLLTVHKHRPHRLVTVAIHRYCRLLTVARRWLLAACKVQAPAKWIAPRW